MQIAETGASPEYSLAKLESAKQWNVALSVLGIAAAAGSLWGRAWLRLVSQTALALLPAVLIYLVQREPLIYAIGKPKRDDRRTDLCIAFMVCGFGLIFGNRDVQFVETQKLFEYAVLIALLGCALIFTAAKQNLKFWSTMFGTALIAGIYGWGLAGCGDSVRDESAPAYFTTRVADKYESHHRGTSYHLVFEPWGPMQAGSGMTVSSETYGETGIGEQACFELHPGVLRVQWYRMVACKDSSER